MSAELVATLSGRLDGMAAGLGRVEERLIGIDGRLGRVEDRMADVDRRLFALGTALAPVVSEAAPSDAPRPQRPTG
ncbi:MAG: hypothetical protein LKI58_07185 [Actinomyces sp.]|nr:hypothetical protein [Actinomyces sp.]MCI1691891.1 hypothetical protein [Actinomyces sp.]MCI1787833.1 hypothetical protein [Actinomyces sp.]MCI1829831.1 hypothetical protein [Actinomyces sp.]